MSNLKNIECYSEYKKYRFINESSQRLDFSNFDDDYISNLEKFDTELKNTILSQNNVYRKWIEKLYSRFHLKV